VGLQVGAALWTRQPTAAPPASHRTLYRQFVEDAVRVEELGFASLWLAEHRFWYDGWCPSPVVAAAAAAGATTRLRFGYGMLLLPQHEPLRFAESVATLDRLSGGRVDLGVALGHRDAEFDGLGLERTRRGRRMDEALEILLSAWGDGPLRYAGNQFDYPAADVTPKPVQRPHPTIWLGGMAPAALRRAARRGLSYLLPQTMYPEEIAQLVELVTKEAADAGMPVGQIGMLKDAWVQPQGERARAQFLPRLRSHYTEESGAWWVLKGAFSGFQRRDLLERQLDRIIDTAAVGDPDEVLNSLQTLARAGVDFLALRFNFDIVSPQAVAESMGLFSREVLPGLR